MIRNVLAAVTLAFGFAVASSAAVVWVQVAPPTAIVETAPAPPGSGYAWVGGYWRWNGVKYVWVSGHYVAHSGAWVPGHWRHVAGSGWYWVPGHWR
jgi:hypothetical protein